MKEHWTCPYCNRDCTLGEDDIRISSTELFLSPLHGHLETEYKIYICPSPACRKIAIEARIYKGRTHPKKIIYEWLLVPESNAKPFPDYIPSQLRNDYYEACLIVNKSPKASATLSRRCLQGMIRDFWGISDRTLNQEILALREHIDHQTWNAIDSVRKVGNIGAHMERDVNTIIDIDPEEANLLIGLIETLFADWYINRYNREQRMLAISELAKTKHAAKEQSA